MSEHEQPWPAGGAPGAAVADRGVPLRWPDLVIMQYPGEQAVGIWVPRGVHGLVWGQEALRRLREEGHFTLEQADAPLDFDLTRAGIPFCYIAEDRKLVGVGGGWADMRPPQSVTVRFPAFGPFAEATTLVYAAGTCQGLVWSDDGLGRLRDAGVGEVGWTNDPPDFMQIFSVAPGCYYDDMGRLVCYR